MSVGREINDGCGVWMMRLWNFALLRNIPRFWEHLEIMERRCEAYDDCFGASSGGPRRFLFLGMYRRYMILVDSAP